MKLKTRILDAYFLRQIGRKGIVATEKEVRRFLDETGWRFYDIDAMVKNFTQWRSRVSEMDIRVE